MATCSSSSTVPRTRASVVEAFSSYETSAGARPAPPPSTRPTTPPAINRRIAGSLQEPESGLAACLHPFWSMLRRASILVAMALLAAVAVERLDLYDQTGRFRGYVLIDEERGRVDVY